MKYRAEVHAGLYKGVECGVSGEVRFLYYTQPTRGAHSSYTSSFLLYIAIKAPPYPSLPRKKLAKMEEIGIDMNVEVS